MTDAYTRSAFKSLTNIDVVNKFFSLLEQGQCAAPEDAFLSSVMQKCFINNSAIAFQKTLSDDERNSVRAQQLWQAGYTTWQHNLSQVSNDRK